MTWGNNFKANAVADTYLKMKTDATAKVVTEKVEELDELSKKTLDSYVDKSDNDAKKHSEKSSDAWVKGDRKTADKHFSKMSDRSFNIGKAIEKSKLTKEDLDDYSLEEIEEFMMSEEYKELDELSKASLGSYVKKSSRERGFSGLAAGGSGAGTRDQKDAVKTMKKRQAGVIKAVDRLTKEETEVVKTNAKGIKHVNVKDKRDDQDVMEPRAQGEKDFLAKLSVNATDEPAAKYKSGAGTIKQATKPVANGPGTYDAKSKLGFKEETDCKDLGDKEDSEKASGKGKSYFSFKEKMSKGK